MPGLLRPHQDRLRACMIPLYTGEEVQHTDHDGTFSYIDPITSITIPLTVADDFGYVCLDKGKR